MEQVAELCKDAIKYFEKHERWKCQFRPAFDFTKSRGVEAYDKLFGPRLIEPLENFLEEDEWVPTADGDHAKPSKVVRISEKEDSAAIEDLASMGLLKKEDIAPVMGGQSDLKLVDPQVKQSELAPFKFKEIDRQDLLSNGAFLEEKSKEPGAANWFRSLYLWLRAHPLTVYGRKGYAYQETYTYQKIILTADGNLVEGRNAWLPHFQLPDPLLRDLAEISQQSKAILHPAILAGAKDEDERQAIRGFLLGLTGVQLLDSKAICKEALLPKILTTAPKPSASDLVKYTSYCQQILGEDIPTGSEFWVLTKQGDIRASKETFLSKEFHPEQDWETCQQYVPGLSFVSSDYLGSITDADQLKGWRQFFEAGGVKKAPDNGVEVFAEHYAVEKLGDTWVNIIPVDKLNFGYDLEAETKTGEKMRVEVKGQSHDQDVELKGNELVAAETHKDSFYLFVVSSIPENPKPYLVKNPAAKSIKDKVTILIDTWKTSPYP